MRIGIFGGTFDPIHNGHLKLCDTIIENFSLEKIYFMPCLTPPHKTRQDISHPYHRYSMVVLGTAKHERFFPSFYEIEKGGASYTIDTLSFFQKVAGEGKQIFFIIGLDSLSEIETWKDHEKILAGWDLIVINRSGYAISDMKKRFPAWISQKIETVPGKYEHPERADASTKIISTKILFARIEPVNISSSSIREKVRKNEPIYGLVPDEIEMYIRKFNLYG